MKISSASGNLLGTNQFYNGWLPCQARSHESIVSEQTHNLEIILFRSAYPITQHSSAKSRNRIPWAKILRKAKKPGFFVLKEFLAAKNRRLWRWTKERLVFLMDMHGRNIENNFKTVV